MANVQAKQEEVTLPLFVVRGKSPSLIGRNWLTKLKLDWSQVYRIQDTNHDSQLQHIVKSILLCLKMNWAHSRV